MDDILKKILATKHKEIAEKKKSLPLATIKTLAQSKAESRGFVEHLKKTANQNSNAVIAEIKRASPSKGIIREHFDPVDIALTYERHGATCLSILTDTQYFHGSDDFIAEVKERVNLPILRKDFIVDPYQIHEAKALGADCILLIVAALKTDQMVELFELAKAIGLDVLVEVHDRIELEQTQRLNLELIGINNRNLKTFETSLSTTIDLLASVPSSATIVTESGIKNSEDVSFMNANNVNCFLVGEAFMRADDPGKALKELFFPEKKRSIVTED